MLGYKNCSMPETGASDLREYETLRQEINNRTTISYTLVALDLAALGAGLSIADKSKAILVALAAISSLLWLYWADHSGQVNRIAAYIAIQLAPRIGADEGRPVLQWEAFLRRFNAGGESTSQVLFGPAQSDPGPSIRRVVSSDWYTTLLFGGAPPLLLGLYVAANARASASAAVEAAIATAAGTVLWAYALINYWHMRRAVSVIAEAILTASNRPLHEEAPASGANPADQE